MTPTALNKNFQVHASLDSQEYKRTQTIPVTDGSVITVICGDPAWPTMNDAAGIPGQSYTINITVSEASPYAVEVIDYSNLGTNSLYGDPEAVLGQPATQCKNTGSGPTFNIKLVEPAYNVDLNDRKVITTINEGGYITVKFDHAVENDLIILME